MRMLMFAAALLLLGCSGRQSSQCDGYVESPDAQCPCVCHEGRLECVPCQRQPDIPVEEPEPKPEPEVDPPNAEETPAEVAESPSEEPKQCEGWSPPTEAEIKEHIKTFGCAPCKCGCVNGEVKCAPCRPCVRPQDNKAKRSDVEGAFDL